VYPAIKTRIILCRLRHYQLKYSSARVWDGVKVTKFCWLSVNVVMITVLSNVSGKVKRTHLHRLNKNDGLDEGQQESGEPVGRLDTTPLKTVEDCEECGDENGQSDHEPCDVDAPEWQERV